MKRFLLDNLKNVWGWKTPRKIVVFSVDDYGNVRLANRKARASLDKAGLKVVSRFDAYDTLESREDLEMLFEVLTSVRDKNKSHAVFSPFSVPCNIDFEKVKEDSFSTYQYELLPVTFEKVSSTEPDAYQGAWELWNEGISEKLLAPQFHGREHLNVKVFEEKLSNKDKELLACLDTRSYTSISATGYSSINYTAAFDFWQFEENSGFEGIIKSGLDCFEKVFGYRSVHFTPPGGREHRVIHGCLRANGIRYIDTPLIKWEHQGKGVYKKSVHYTGRKNKDQLTECVRNVVFEPSSDRGVDWVSYALKQIEAAFRWHRPAVISSHRVNFCGHISPENREKGLTALKALVKAIVHRWPEVEFMSSAELMALVERG